MARTVAEINAGHALADTKNSAHADAVAGTGASGHAQTGPNNSGHAQARCELASYDVASSVCYDTDDDDPCDLASDSEAEEGASDSGISVGTTAIS